jgi:alanyl-tRNA synthetase
MITSNELRQKFLDFFQNKHHTVVPSSSLIPGNDPTLLFTNAGMVQFKDVFLGLDKRSYQRATSSQRCVRAGGKHNDLENVGYTARHHTFFEMLGNFSFGDYFKREAIQFAWEFLTEVLQLPKERLWVTVFEEDDEAADIWLKEMQINPERFSRCGAHDNFWAMGDTGPCGPCTEIFYDHGPEVAGGPPGSPEADGDRYIEIWNLVFMQYERSTDGKLTPLPKPSVDTGMGLERILAVLQGVHNNYDTDIFQPVLSATAKMAGLTDLTNTSLRVIADHIRSCAFLIADGVIPSNEGRGYVLRRIIRRAIRHGNKLGINKAFFHTLVAPLADKMRDAYPELALSQTTIERVLLQEEQQFARTLENGLKILEEAIQEIYGTIIPGAVVFKLYDTYGFPVDLTADIARERGLTLDIAGFEVEMEKQRKQSQAGNQFAIDYTKRLELDQVTDFTGYEQLQHEASVVAVIKDGVVVDKLNANETGMIVLNHTPFYAESGGQIGDQGRLFNDQIEFVVHDVRKEGQAYLHVGLLQKGSVVIGDNLQAAVDYSKRTATQLNHSATHLLHAALRNLLGDHVTQKGSLVGPERLRFDFTHHAALTAEEVRILEHAVNQQIRANLVVETKIMSPEAAKQEGAMALFGEKYGEQVRVLAMGSFSKELCGGTHVQRTGEIGVFKIISEAGVAAGVRRIEALTGEYALQWFAALENQLQGMAQLLKTSRDGLLDKAKKNIEQLQIFEKQVAQLQQKLANGAGQDLSQHIEDIQGIKFIAAEIDGLDMTGLRNAVDQFKNKLGTAVIVFASVVDNRVQLVVGVTKDCTDRIKANELINEIAQYINGKGGGRPDFAQAGGDNVAGLQQAFKTAKSCVTEKLK